MRLVFDNNVLISASLDWNSNPAKCIVKARAHQHKILTSKIALAELRATFLNIKFDRYLSFSNRIDYCETFAQEALLIEPTVQFSYCRDPKDNIFLELAWDGNADLIITGDKDLLSLNPFRGIPIINPRQYLDQY